VVHAEGWLGVHRSANNPTKLPEFRSASTLIRYAKRTKLACWFSSSGRHGKSERVKSDL